MTIDTNELRQSLGAVQPEEVAELLDRIEAAEKEAAYIKEVEFPRKMRAVAVGWETKCARLEQELDALRAELETERMRLAACGVVALANTPDSAKQTREMRPEYWSASCGDVARMVDENIKLRARIEVMERQEPVGEVVHNGESAGLYDILEQGALVYSLPGAQPAPSVPDLLESLRCACNYIDKLGGVIQQYRAMLASPEAKP